MTNMGCIQAEISKGSLSSLCEIFRDWEQFSEEGVIYSQVVFTIDEQNEGSSKRDPL